jgi:hypothetical protein
VLEMNRFAHLALINYVALKAGVCEIQRFHFYYYSYNISSLAEFYL